MDHATATVLTDNVLNPGAPEMLWGLTRGGFSFTIELIALGEFVSDIEDWQCISTALARPAKALAEGMSLEGSGDDGPSWAGSSKTVFQREPWLVEL